MAEEIFKLEAFLEALKADTDSYRETFKAVGKYPGTLVQAVALYEETLEKYKKLGEAYKDLESKEARHGSKTGCAIERPIERPYVLVLIDAHTHGFAEMFTKCGESGGAAAAEHIRKCVRRSATHRIITRVYADLRTLPGSKPVDENNGEVRQLAAFAAGFSQYDDLFDFTDSGSEATVETKVMTAFKDAIDDAQCKDIFIGAWRKPEYLSMLSPYGKGNHGKVTLLPGKYEASGIKHLGFRLAFAGPPQGAPRDDVRNILFWTKADTAPRGVCLEFLKGRCFQQDCQLFHSPVRHPSKPLRQQLRLRDAEPDKPVAAKDSSQWETMDGLSSKPVRDPLLNNDTEVDLTSPVVRAALLPQQMHSLDIPVNSSNLRLDPYIECPSKDDWAAYNLKFGEMSPCNYFHLLPGCNRKDCLYSHDRHSAASRRVHIYITRRFPCPKGGACRNDRCFSGHICQNPYCLDTGSKIGSCKLPKKMHTRDFAIHAWKLNENERPGSRIMRSKIADDAAAIDTSPQIKSPSSAPGDLAAKPHVQQDATNDDKPILQDVVSGQNLIQQHVTSDENLVQQENSGVQEEGAINVQQEKSQILQVHPPKTITSESSSPAEDRTFASLIDLSIAQWFK